MVVFCDLDDEASQAPDPLANPHFTDDLTWRQRQSSVTKAAAISGREVSLRQADSAELHDRPNPNVNGFSAALSCYPIVFQLAQQLDLNDLHDLSLTCRQFRVNLLQYRDQLIKQTLRCTNESRTMGPRLADRMRQSREAWHDRGGAVSLMGSGRIQSGRFGSCARDMVSECRRCGEVVCRNCVIKAPPTTALKGRYRRLCRTCTKAPLALLTKASTARVDDDTLLQLFDNHGHLRAAHHSTLLRAHKGLLTGAATDEMSQAGLVRNRDAAIDPTSFTDSAFTRGPCTCLDRIFLCHPCGRSLRSEDDTYMHGWKWRTHYSAKLGHGLGTGIGEGNEGVKCGRRDACLAARVVEREIECPADELAELHRELERVDAEAAFCSLRPVASSTTAPLSPQRSWEGTSYLAQEMEGVGGALKLKVRKRARVGAVVREYEDERRSSGAGFLDRERRAQSRSWCAWCDRVILSSRDLAQASPGAVGAVDRRGSSSTFTSSSSGSCSDGSP